MKTHFCRREWGTRLELALEETKALCNLKVTYQVNRKLIE